MFSKEGTVASMSVANAEGYAFNFGRQERVGMSLNAVIGDVSKT